MRIGFKKQLIIVAGGLILVVSGVVLLAGVSMRMLSAVRAYVGAESLWSKAQKNAGMHLKRYSHSFQESDYEHFLAELRVPLGDGRARMEMDKPVYNEAIARQGLLEGGIAEDDIDSMIWFYRTFHDSENMKPAINRWAIGDLRIRDLLNIGERAHALVLSGNANQATMRPLMDEVDWLNDQVAPPPQSFAGLLGAAARHIENVLLAVLIVTAALLVLGGCWAYFLVLRNIENSDREMRASRDKALELSRAKSQFVANMSHEIRTPMNGVLGMLQLLLDTRLNGEQREFAQIAHDSGVALLNIINDVLDFSRIEAGKLELRPAPFLLRDLVSGVQVLLNERAERKRIVLGSQIASELPPIVHGDPARLRQILMNLVGNAVKFTDQGSVRICVSSAGEDRVRFEVRDTGIGIAPGVERKLFDSFSQADGSITRKYGGAGLGLAISSQLVGLMGGEIGVRSKLGKGSTFWFEVRLPAETGEPHSSAALELEA